MTAPTRWSAEDERAYQANAERIAAAEILDAEFDERVRAAEQHAIQSRIVALYDRVLASKV